MMTLLIGNIALALQATVVRLLSRANAFMLGHIVFFLIFFPLLHLIGLLTGGDTWLRYLPEYYVLTHLVVFVYLLVFVFVALGSARVYPGNASIVAAVTEIRDGIFISVFLGWIFVKAYLISMYGAIGVFALRGVAASEGAIVRFSFVDTVLDRYATYIAVGATVAVLIKIAIGQWRLRSVCCVTFVAFLLAFLLAGEAEFGVRRFVMLLGIIGVLIAAYRAGMTPYRFLVKRWLTAVLVAVGVLGFAAWYQNVRSNIYQPEVVEELVSLNPSGLAKVAWHAATSRIDSAEELTSLIRPGPFELLYGLTELRARGEATTRGELVGTSLLMIVPRVWVGDDKISVNVDDIIMDRYGSESVGSYFSHDLPTSLLTIFVSDFGLWGVLGAPMVLLVSFALYGAPLRTLRRSSAVTLLCLSFLFATAANVENDLVAALSGARDFIFGVVTVLVIQMLVRAMTRAVRTLRAVG